MAQLNWRPGMWPPGGPEFGWEFTNPLLSHVGVVDGPMKRTPSNLSMSAVPDGAHWPQQHMMHPMMYPHFHPSMMYLSGSQSHIMGGPPGQMMMMNPGPQPYDPRPPSPASSQRSRRSQKSQRSSQRSSQKQNPHGGSSSSKPSGRWSESEDFSGDSDDSLRVRPTSPRKSSVSSRSSKSKDYGPVNSAPMTRPTSKTTAPVTKSGRDWECDHCTYVNKADTRICAVCCRTSDRPLDCDQQAAEDEDLPVVMSNLTFNIKEDRARESIPVQLKSEQLLTKDKSPNRPSDSSKDSKKYDNVRKKYEDVSKHYEDVNDMLKRLQVRKEDPHKSQSSSQIVATQELSNWLPDQNRNSLLDEIDAVEDEESQEEEEERYIEMEEKEPLYERVQFPPASATSAAAAVPTNKPEEGQGNFSIDGYLRAAERAKRARFRDY